MKRGFIILTIILTISLPGFGYDLTILTEELPPLNFTNAASDKASGFSVEVVRMLINKAGIHPVGGDIRVMPWARAYRMAEKEPNVMLFSMTRTENREDKFKWVGPIAPRTVWLWKLKERSEIVVTTIDEARPYRIGGVYGFAISNYLQEQGFIVDMTSEINHNLLKLYSHRVDLITAMDLEIAYHVKRHGKPLDRLARLVKIDDQYSFYIAVSLDTADDVVKRLQQALDLMKSDGTYDTIHANYLR